MKIIDDVELREFDFQSSQAKETVKYLTYSELDRIQQILEDAYPDGMTDSNLEDIFGFERDTIANWIGYDNFDQIVERMQERAIESKGLHCHRKAIRNKRKVEAWDWDSGSEVTLDRDNHMYVCDYCLQAIESHEGRQRTLKIEVDEDDEEESRCDWCEECGFDTLYEI